MAVYLPLINFANFSIHYLITVIPPTKNSVFCPIGILSTIAVFFSLLKTTVIIAGIIAAIHAMVFPF